MATTSSSPSPPFTSPASLPPDAIANHNSPPLEGPSLPAVLAAATTSASETGSMNDEDCLANPNSNIPAGTISLPPPKPGLDASAELLHISFNQDCGCFTAGTTSGFCIYSCDPFRKIFSRVVPGGGGFGAVQMLFRCNVIALVGGGAFPAFPPSKAMIWDDNQGRCIGELCFRSTVRAVRLRRDRVFVAVDNKVFVYNFTDLKLLHQIETVSNPRGLVAVSQQQGALVLVCPGTTKGQIRIENYAIKKTKYINAHDSQISCLEMSQDGRLIATASTKGTLVRVFSTVDGTLLQEVRRGADRAEIYSLAFSPDMQWLAASSDKGTVHVFSLKINLGLTSNDRPLPAPEPDVPRLSPPLSFIKGVLPKYFHSEWSVAQFRLQEGTQYFAAFGHQKNTLVIIGMDGSFHRCQFDPSVGGEMKVLESHNFLEPNGVL